MKATTKTIFKNFINSSSTDDDSFLGTQAIVVTKIIETYLKKRLTLRTYTEKIDGDGSDRIILSNRPAMKITGVSFSDVAQTVSNFSIINNGILVHDDDYFPAGIRNIEVTYYAGFEKIEINDDNCGLKIEYDGSDYEIEIDTGTYIVSDLLAELKSEIESEIDDVTFTITYNYVTNKFTITATEQFKLIFSAANGVSNSIANDLGFALTDTDAATSHTADNEVLPIPDDIIHCANSMLLRIYNDQINKERFDLKSKQSHDGGTTSYDMNDFPSGIKLILDNYKKVL